jgi:hypothetical protein
MMLAMSSTRIPVKLQHMKWLAEIRFGVYKEALGIRPGPCERERGLRVYTEAPGFRLGPVR